MVVSKTPAVEDLLAESRFHVLPDRHILHGVYTEYGASSQMDFRGIAS